MSKLLDNSVLVLDSTFRVTNVTTPKQALIDMSKDTMTAVLIHGQDSFEAVSWERWLELEPLSAEFSVATARRVVRLPTVVVAVNYIMAKEAIRELPLTPENVMKVHGGICGYTGRKIGKKGNIDHVVSRHQGGKDEWSNVTWSDPDVNTKKGPRTPKQAGLPEPRIIVPRARLKQIQPRSDRPEWRLFMPTHRPHAVVVGN